MTATHDPAAFYEYAESNMVVCGACLDDDLRKTKRGEYVGEERVYQGMFTRLPAGEAYQCDGCLEQSPEYDALGEEP